ncbi:hypothetical protein HJG54_20345 [Leptolyngbya sp. NK1-12]|uniref:Calcium-binding protein n=1 Tax=Leptolyngbya sp. NK1-12 TaxID=2547451 RepID=A0AA96WMB6_9CYAN|nr:calcium-binding protein [Leptolyngbya sp. NK1-12]WNZ24966.1 hypothetical protein HJG54_20345 [Leptolyngbya sp. NK1-12]
MAFIPGSPNDDNPLGTLDPDLILGNDGNDTLDGGTGGDFDNDFLYGEQGNDLLLGNNGNDYLDGGNGNDGLRGGNGIDILVAGAGDDGAQGDDGNDFIYGLNGNDRLDGRNNDDYIDGGNNDDFLTGGDGNDTLIGSFGNDSLTGDFGNDSLFGGPGQDAFGFGQLGIVLASAGSSQVRQGLGIDFTILGVDTIYDFTIGEDKIYLGRSFQLSNGRADIAFVANDGEVATSSGKVVYSRGTGNLFFNPNGAESGLGDRGGQFAIVFGAPNLTASDFVTQAEAVNGLVPVLPVSA